MGFWDWVTRRKRYFFESLKSEEAVKNEVDWEMGHFNFVKYVEKYQNYYNNYPKVKSALLTISGQVMAEGVFTIPAERTDTKSGKTEKYPRSIEAKVQIDKLNKKIKLDEMVQATAKRMVQYGTCFLEKTFDPEFSVQMVVPRYQKYMTPRWNTASGRLEGWDMKIRNVLKANWNLDEIVVFTWDVDENYPYGTSLLVGIDRELNISDNILNGLEKHMKRSAWATHIVQIGDGTYTPGETEMKAFRRQIRDGEVGQTIITNAPVGKETLGAGDTETQMVPDVLAFEADQVTDGLMVPPISKLASSTQASSVIMTDWARANLITPVQRIIKRVIEEEVYWPYLEDLGYSTRVVPSLSFNPPEAGRLDEAKYWAELITARVASPKQAATDLGMEWDADYWKEQEALMLKHQQADKAVTQTKKPAETPKPAEPEAPPKSASEIMVIVPDENRAV